MVVCITTRTHKKQHDNKKRTMTRRERTNALNTHREHKTSPNRQKTNVLNTNNSIIVPTLNAYHALSRIRGSHHEPVRGRKHSHDTMRAWYSCPLRGIHVSSLRARLILPSQVGMRCVLHCLFLTRLWCVVVSGILLLRGGVLWGVCVCVCFWRLGRCVGCGVFRLCRSGWVMFLCGFCFLVVWRSMVFSCGGVFWGVFLVVGFGFLWVCILPLLGFFVGGGFYFFVFPRAYLCI